MPVVNARQCESAPSILPPRSLCEPASAGFAGFARRSMVEMWPRVDASRSLTTVTRVARAPLTRTSRKQRPDSGPLPANRQVAPCPWDNDTLPPNQFRKKGTVRSRGTFCVPSSHPVPVDTASVPRTRVVPVPVPHQQHHLPPDTQRPHFQITREPIANSRVT
jgi:hypothetical protein